MPPSRHIIPVTKFGRANTYPQLEEKKYCHIANNGTYNISIVIKVYWCKTHATQTNKTHHDICNLRQTQQEWDKGWFVTNASTFCTYRTQKLKLCRFVYLILLEYLKHHTMNTAYKFSVQQNFTFDRMKQVPSSVEIMDILLDLHEHNCQSILYYRTARIQLSKNFSLQNKNTLNLVCFWVTKTTISSLFLAPETQLIFFEKKLYFQTQFSQILAKISAPVSDINFRKISFSP